MIFMTYKLNKPCWNNESWSRDSNSVGYIRRYLQNQPMSFLYWFKLLRRCKKHRLCFCPCHALQLFKRNNVPSCNVMQRIRFLGCVHMRPESTSIWFDSTKPLKLTLQHNRNTEDWSIFTNHVNGQRAIVPEQKGDLLGLSNAALDYCCKKALVVGRWYTSDLNRIELSNLGSCVWLECFIFIFIFFKAKPHLSI